MSGKKIVVIKSMKLAGYLMQHGFPLERSAPDRENPAFNIFLFRDSEMLWDAVDKYNTEQAMNENDSYEN